MLYEIETNSMPAAIKALELGQRRIPFKTRIIFD